jgi:glycosyltransferase involved in cell wall biosynthesis
VEKLGRPDIHHVHILTRPAVIAFCYRLIFRTPYVVSEHWSRYLRAGSFAGSLRKSVTRMMVKSASAVTTVTKNLAYAMQEDHRLTNHAYSVLANVVDPIFYRDYPKRPPNNETTFVHVSCFEDQSKNISGLLRVARLLKDNGQRFKLILIGEGMDFDSMVHYATDLGLTDNQVVFTGLLQGKALVKKMLEADALVVSSHYENLPVVIIEGMALGLPVISTRVGGIDEIVDTSNGCLVTPGDEQQLAHAMAQFIEGSLAFNPELIKDKSRATYSSEAVGERIVALYQKILQNR